MEGKERITSVRIRRAAIALLILPHLWTVGELELAAGAQERPQQLRGEVIAVSNGRIQIRLAQPDWLPRAGSAVELGAELSGMWVPLKGSFVIIQIDADAVAAMAAGSEDHGTPAAGMLALIRTPYPNHPQSRAEYVKSRESEAAVMTMANAGNPLAQNIIAIGCENRGDHDAALVWWERSSKGSSERVIVTRSALGRAKILAIRGSFQAAASILEDAASRTAPRADERVFTAYSTSAGAPNPVEAHVRVLMELGDLHRGNPGGAEESKRWYRAAAEVMAATAKTGAPGPAQPTHQAYLLLLNQLANLYLLALGDQAAALPWLQTAARAGDRTAQSTLTRLGRPW